LYCAEVVYKALDYCQEVSKFKCCRLTSTEESMCLPVQLKKSDPDLH